MKTTTKALLLVLMAPAFAHAQAVLKMNSYLDEVKSQHQGYKGSSENRQGANDRAAQAELLTSFRLEGNYQLINDQKLSENPSLTYDKLTTETYSLGIAKTTTFGLDAKLSYDMGSMKFVNPNVDMTGLNPMTSATPTLSLTQSLWQNGFGRLTTAQVEATQAQADFEKESSQAEMDALIQKAMTVYWNLALQREIVEIQKAALKQSQALYDYNAKRSKMNLMDRSDALQAKATFEAKKLDVQAAIDAEEALKREFNLYRNKSANENPGALEPVNFDFIAKMKVPETHGDRADVKAAKAQAKATAASFKVTEESNKPVLNLYGSYSLNGRSTSYNHAMSDTTTSNRPTTTIGLKLSMPLDFGSMGRVESGAKAQAKAADMIYQQKVLDQTATWIDLKERVITVQRRVEISGSIIQAESEKLEYERRRLKEGRTSTYQVLQFEQDYINARLTRVQNASELISLISQIQLFNSSEQGGQ